MLGPPDNSARFAPHWFDRAYTLNQVCIICNVPYDTCFRWLQLIKATGLFFGEKRGREWLFDCHELYTYRILAAFFRFGMPVTAGQIRAVVHFTFGDDGVPRIPEGKLIQTASDAEFLVNATALYHAIAEATKPEADAHA